uniref:Uncharacterized protein n=1 Tax=Peromyscus maniculatus bairdii TaxID=230844 RepID=A0A8C8US92_PERMB
HRPGSQSSGMESASSAVQMGVSFRSLLGEGFTCSLAALTSRTPSQGGGPTPPRLSGSSSSCSCCSDLARCIWSSRSCTRSSMMASRSSSSSSSLSLSLSEEYSSVSLRPCCWRL